MPTDVYDRAIYLRQLSQEGNEVIIKILHKVLAQPPFYNSTVYIVVWLLKIY